MKRYRPRAARPAKPPRPGLKSLFGQPDAAFYRLPELEIRGGSVLTDGCRRVLEFTPRTHLPGYGAVGYYIVWRGPGDRIAGRQTG